MSKQIVREDTQVNKELISTVLSQNLICILKAFPIIIIVSFLSGGIIFRSPIAVYFGIFSLVENLINGLILKPFFLKTVYGGDRYRHLPYLGRGHRPDGAKFCGCFIQPNQVININLDNHKRSRSKTRRPEKKLVKIEQINKSTSYGMPSGHAQTVASFATFWTIYLLNSGGLIANAFSIFYLWAISIAVSASRIYLGCHTLQQVYIGNIFGVFFGLLLGRFIL